ncbi:MAG: 50S ribosomal protein L17 [bacterium]|nr:50S ribosomal protein L17 [bacterium]
MRHRKKGKILGRKRNSRRALRRSLVRSLILSGKIQTTETKAKVVRSDAEKMITKARSNTLAARRQAAASLDGRAIKQLFDVLGPRYKDRKGGYTRIMKTNPRKGDNARMAVIEFV